MHHHRCEREVLHSAQDLVQRAGRLVRLLEALD
jgi:hypothetical protein